jgi:hypothetical protein
MNLLMLLMSFRIYKFKLWDVLDLVLLVLARHSKLIILHIERRGNLLLC